MITSKELAEKIHMFYNLLYHLDDYIKNKKERKGQLRLSKNIRLVLREVISSKNNVKYFINKEEIDTHLGKLLITKKTKKEEELYNYIKTMTPLSFNQKNLNTINLFYNSKNESFVLNYIILEKIFSIIRFCFVETIRRHKKELIKNIENKNNTNFSLHKIDDKDEVNTIYNLNDFLLTKKNSILKKKFETKKEEEFDTSSSNKGLKRIRSNQAFDIKRLNDSSNKSQASINISSLINNNDNVNNIISSQNNQISEFIRKNTNLLRNLRWQVKIIDDKIKLSQIKEKPDKNLINKIISIKKHANFPIIKAYKKIQNKSVEKNIKKEFIDTNLVSENKIETNIILENIMKSKKINCPRTTLYNKKLPKQNKSGIFSYYDYKNILPLFKLSKLNTTNGY